jgi:hypothetical protein
VAIGSVFWHHSRTPLRWDRGTTCNSSAPSMLQKCDHSNKPLWFKFFTAYVQLSRHILRQGQCNNNILIWTSIFLYHSSWTYCMEHSILPHQLWYQQGNSFYGATTRCCLHASNIFGEWKSMPAKAIIDCWKQEEMSDARLWTVDPNQCSARKWLVFAACMWRIINVEQWMFSAAFLEASQSHRPGKLLCKIVH